MGIWPAIYAALLIPSARSATKASSAAPLPGLALATGDCSHAVCQGPCACHRLRHEARSTCMSGTCITILRINACALECRHLSGGTALTVLYVFFGRRSCRRGPSWQPRLAVGIFALGPYFALWAPSREAKAPPAGGGAAGLEGKLGLKGTESRIGAWLILAGVVATVLAR